MTCSGRTVGLGWKPGQGLSPAGRQAVATALRVLDVLDTELVPLRKQIAAFARRQPGCRALQGHYGVGEITAAALWAELGDTRRFSSSRKVVRHTGLDITVYSSDGKRAPGRLSRQGSPLLRWALFEAAKCAARPGAPTTPTTPRSATASAVTGPRYRSPARSPDGHTTPCVPSATKPWPPSRTQVAGARICPNTADAAACSLPPPCRHASGATASKDRAAAPHVSHPSIIMSPDRTGPRTEIRLGARAPGTTYETPRKETRNDLTALPVLLRRGQPAPVLAVVKVARPRASPCGRLHLDHGCGRTHLQPGGPGRKNDQHLTGVPQQIRGAS